MGEMGKWRRITHFLGLAVVVFLILDSLNVLISLVCLLATSVRTLAVWTPYLLG